MATMASMRWKARRWDYLVALHGRIQPSDEAWDRYGALLEAAPVPADVRGIAVSLRGAPNARQRARHLEIHRRIGMPRDVLACVVTDSAFTVGVINAFAFTGLVQGIHGFPLRNLFTALEYVGVERHERERLVADLLRLGETVDDTNPMRVALENARRAS